MADIILHGEREVLGGCNTLNTRLERIIKCAIPVRYSNSYNRQKVRNQFLSDGFDEEAPVFCMW